MRSTNIPERHATSGTWTRCREFPFRTTGLTYVAASRSESMGYQTQKPLALLERIIAASSKEGDVVLDPFCGCGTAIAAAEKLKRQLDWCRHHPPGRRPHEEPAQDGLQHPARPGLPRSSASRWTRAAHAPWRSRTASSSSSGPCLCWRPSRGNRTSAARTEA